MSDRLEQLVRARPRDRFLRASGIAAVALLAGVWLFGGLDLRDAFTARRADNFARFLGELRPYPLQGRDWDWGKNS